MVAFAYFKLIRFPILLLIVVIQYATRYFLIEPMLGINRYSLIMSDLLFFYLVMATICIAAGGYAINDYFDVKIDRMNKPRIVVVDRLVRRRVAMAFHVVLSGIGLLLSAYVSWAVGMWKLTPLFIFAVFSLWFYSTNLKNQFLIGNVVIAVLAGCVPLIVGLFEIPLQNAAHPEMIAELGFSIFNIPAFWILGYALIIAVLTLAREITKDVIDIRGDKYFGCRTVPIVLGIRTTKYIIIAIYTVLGAILTWLYMNYLTVHTGMTPVFLVIVLSIVFQFIIIFRARTKKHFLYSAHLNNAITLLVIFSTLLVKLNIMTHFA